MMYALWIIPIILVGVILVSYRWGKSDAKLDVSKDAAEDQKKTAEIFAKPARSKSDILDFMRRKS